MSSKPVLLVVDDDTNVLQAMERDLNRRFGADYRVVTADSPIAALERLQQIRKRGGEVALVVANQWMPDMTGAEFLRRAQEIYPDAQRGVLIMFTDWIRLSFSNESAVGPLQQAAILGRIDFLLRSEEHTSELQSRHYLVC